MSGLLTRRRAMMQSAGTDSRLKDYEAPWIPARTSAFESGIKFNFSDTTTDARYPTNVDAAMVDSLYFICKSASAVYITGFNQGANPNWAARFATRTSGYSPNFQGIHESTGVVQAGGYYYPYIRLTKASVDTGTTNFLTSLSNGNFAYNGTRGYIRMTVPSNLDWWVIQSDTFDASIVPLLPIH